MKNLTNDILSTAYADNLLKRFLKYVQIYSESDSAAADGGAQPSTPQQWDMAKALSAELQSLGLEDVQTTDHCYTYARLPATKGCESAASFCLLAHMDTVDEVSGKDVKPLVHKDYAGNAIVLPSGITIDPAADEALLQAGKEHDTVITSDGSTLLGADDKAGVAEIMTAIEFLVQHPELPHGTIEVIFSPDEETGHGMDNVPLALLRSKQCYTVDGGHIGGLETECFNAFRSDVVFTGKAKHTGSARPDMVNAVSMSASFVSNLPRQEMPETTDGYMGFYAPMEVTASMESAKVSLLLRDFTKEGMERRKHIVELVAQMTAETFGGTVQVSHTQQYLNMKETMDKNPAATEKLVAAYRDAGITPEFTPIRGGTDGSRLTEMGIPTPNIFTGGHNYHSRYEWASLRQMICATEVLIQLAAQWAHSPAEKN
ncbi:MAG: peptidase T [Treponema sp.]|nr:peptidase T [Treponema sp.]